MKSMHVENIIERLAMVIYQVRSMMLQKTSLIFIINGGYVPHAPVTSRADYRKIPVKLLLTAIILFA